jgi:hypothetical protein
VTTAAATIRPAMTEPTDLDERVARLAARRAANTSPANAPKRHRRKARVGRVLAAGISSSAFFSIVGVLAANATTNTSTVASALPQVPITGPVETIAPATTATTVVVKVVHHKRYVDPNGTPVSPPTTRATVASASGGSSGSGSSTHSTAGAPVTSGHAPTGGGTSGSGGGGTSPAPTPAPTTPVTHPAAPPTTVFTPPPAPPPPPCTGSKCPH